MNALIAWLPSVSGTTTGYQPVGRNGPALLATVAPPFESSFHAHPEETSPRASEGLVLLGLVASSCSWDESLQEYDSVVGNVDVGHWGRERWAMTLLRYGTSSYHIALLIDKQHGRTGIEFYVPDDKGIGHKAIENAALFEERLGLKAKPFDAKKASGLRFYKEGCKIKNNEGEWPGFIAEQLDWALKMKKLIEELGL